MKWLTRSLWLAAWSFWLWLGFGLYRELPRDLGPVVCKLPFKDLGLSLVGFLPDSKLLAFLGQTGVGWQIVIIDSETGAKVRTVALSYESGAFWNPNDNPVAVRQHGVVFRAVSAEPPLSTRGSVQAVDLRNGQTRTIIESAATGLTVHSRHPWVALAEIPDQGHRTQRVVVFDLRTGQRLFVGPTTQQFPFGGMSFLSDGEIISVPMERTQANLHSDGTMRYEYWKVSGTPVQVTWEEALGSDESMGPTNVTNEGLSIRPMPHQSVFFNETERWCLPFAERRPGSGLETYAIRRPIDAGLHSRLRASNGNRPSAINTAGTLVVTDDGAVCRIPPPPNFSLLALCQAILALPLVLLWAVLRWRRKRRTHFAEEAS